MKQNAESYLTEVTKSMSKANRTKKELLPADREEFLAELKTRFEKNMNRHQGLEWAKVRAKLEADAKKLWSLTEMERTGGEPDVVGFDKKRANSSFMIVQRKVLKGAEVFVTTVKRWRNGKNTNRKIALSIWQATWELSF